MLTANVISSCNKHQHSNKKPEDNNVQTSFFLFSFVLKSRCIAFSALGWWSAIVCSSQMLIINFNDLTLFMKTLQRTVCWFSLFLYSVDTVRHCCHCALCICTCGETVSHHCLSSNSTTFIVLGAESDTGEGDIQALNSANDLWMVSDFGTDSDLLLLHSLSLRHTKIRL